MCTRSRFGSLAAVGLLPLSLLAQPTLAPRAPEREPTELRTPEPEAAATVEIAEEGTYLVDIGTRIPLNMVNSVSTKHSQEGDRVYLETTFPIAVDGRIVIPAGSYVLGTINAMERPGRVTGRGEFFLRFDSLMLPNGVVRDFSARVSGLDGRAAEDLDKEEGVISSEGNKSGDARTVVEATAMGASIGGLAGIGTNPGMGVGIGAAAGATAGLLGVLLSRGPDAVLAKGTTIEMVLDRQLIYTESELDFSGTPPRYNQQGGGPLPSVKTQQRRFP